MGHSYRTLLRDTLKGHSCETLLWDTVAGHSCGTLILDTLVGDTLVGHSCGTLLWDTLVGHSCTKLEDTLVGHSCRTLLWGTLRTRLPPKVTRQVSKTSVSYETSSKSHMSSLLWDTLVGHSSYETSSKSHTSSLQNERFVRDFLQKSHVKSPKRAFRTRLPPKVMRQVSKTSVSYETSSKTHMSKSAKRDFVRDFLQKSSGNTHRSTHTSRSPAKQFRESSPSKQYPLTRQSHCDSDIHLYHNSRPHSSLRLPRIFPHPHV